MAAAGRRKGATLRCSLTDDGRLDLSNIDELVTERTKVVSLVWVSNMLGTVNPVATSRPGHEVGALVVLDLTGGAELPGRRGPLGADFLAFTGHKMAGPTGIGVLWGAAGSWERCPFLGGGEMIETSDERSTYAGSAQVRGRHAADRPGHQPRCRRRLPVGGRRGTDRRSRHAITACARLDRLQARRRPQVVGPRTARSTARARRRRSSSRGYRHGVGQILDSRGWRCRLDTVLPARCACASGSTTTRASLLPLHGLAGGRRDDRRPARGESSAAGWLLRERSLRPHSAVATT